MMPKMMSSDQLVPELLTVGELFGGETTYTVPIYQRNYAWRAEQIEQLINDVRDAISGQETGYFLGNLIVTQRADESDFEVIDGQQRLTTLYLLLTFLEKEGPSLTHRGKLLYQSRHKASEALRRIATNYSSQAEKEDGAIHEAFNVITQFFKQHKKVDRQEFSDFLRSKVSVVRASLPAKTDLNRYFEIMNTRGQQLNQVDIVKARLMSRLPANERACFAWIWDACANMDSYVQMSLTYGDTKTRRAIFGDDWSWLQTKNFEGLRKKFEGKDTQSSGATFSDSLSLEAALQRYARSVEPESREDDDNDRFRSTIEFSTFLLHVLKVVNNQESEDEGQLDDKRLIRQFDEAGGTGLEAKAQWVRNFSFQLLKLRNVFDAFILKRQYTATNTEDGDWSLQRLLMRKSVSKKGLERDTSGYINTFSRSVSDIEEDGDVDSTTGEILLLQSMLRVTYTSPRTMHWITLVLRRVSAMKQFSGADAIVRRELLADLRNYARGKVKESFFIKPQPQGFDISRITFTYLDYLLWERQKRPQAFKFVFRNSIEHFYPQHPNQSQSGEKVSPGNLHLLGNLALVSVSANSKFSNSLPRAKAENFKDTIESQSLKLRKMASITLSKGWADDKIQAHHEDVVDILWSDVRPLDS